VEYAGRDGAAAVTGLFSAAPPVVRGKEPSRFAGGYLKLEALLFCEQKRSKKNFANLNRAGETFRGPDKQKFFGYFFQKSVPSGLTGG
jgi:hypothetical protein